ncbi:hypothetical protein [Cellvibrio fibrivorans]|uniref:Uncharacterized protein n=1 Tax=Cellvibrio fibrivorans TaxID=126350 RepID=A0ABU1V0G1_9GAMM|nr:hypothetical protein [Cellvibrio fibrivorans]MDR7090890.1 hypothetical protein [Cellvibrio fibrivorans]
MSNWVKIGKNGGVTTIESASDGFFQSRSINPNKNIQASAALPVGSYFLAAYQSSFWVFRFGLNDTLLVKVSFSLRSTESLLAA